MNTAAYLRKIRITRTSNTYESYKQALESIGRYNGDLLKFIEKSKLSDSTIKHHMVIYGRYLSYLGKLDKETQEIISEYRVNTKEEPCPTLEEYHLCKATVSRRYTHAFLLASQCGLRVSEIAKLTKEDIAENYVILRDTKNHTTVKQPITQEVSRSLREIPWVDYGTTRAIQAYFQRLHEKCNCGHLTVHSWRRWYINCLVRSGTEITLVRAAARHKAISSTQRYVNTESSMVEQAIQNTFI